MRTVILGGGGQLATDLEQALVEWELTALPHRELDVCSFGDVRRSLESKKPEVVINTAAFHHVDNCEDEWERAFAVNAFACRNLAEVCSDIDATLVHISTDYVFSGDQSTPYEESALPDPRSVYGASKVAGEFFVKTYCPKHLIVRSSGLYGLAGASGKGGNFVETMIRLAKSGKPLSVVDDQIMAPTNTQDLAVKVREVIAAGGRGIFHITNQGSCSWYEYAAKIFELAGLRPELRPTTTEAYGAKAARPAYSVLRNAKLEDLGLRPMPEWEVSLQRYLAEKGHV